MNSSRRARWIVFASLLGPAISCWSGAFAYDDADNDPYYSDQSFEEDQNGGAGFDPWVILDLGLPSASVGRDLVHWGILGSDADDWYSWRLSGGSAMGRGLPASATSGSWTFRAVHTVSNPNNSGFSGFSLKSSANTALEAGELLRFGFNPQADAPPIDYGGIWVSTDQGAHYTFLDCPWDDGNGAPLEYSVTWDGTGEYTLSVKHLTEDLEAHFDSQTDFTLPPMPAGAVTMLGTALFGSTSNEQLTFDAFAVTYVPEPAAAASAFAFIAVAFTCSLVFRRCSPVASAGSAAPAPKPIDRTRD